MKTLDFCDNKYYTIRDLLCIMTKLRSEDGCPWDKEQDHHSIRNNFIEEVYEAIEAIDTNDTELLREELGDVLLQVVFHCEMEKEQSNFTFDDVVDELCKKLIVRHPHVFGEVDANDTNTVLSNWEKIKNDTKGILTYTETLKKVPKVLPSLMRAEKIGKRAGKSGMDFPDISSALNCVKSEISELELALSNNDKENIEEEFGDLLLSCVNLSRKLNVNAEHSLAKSCDKFINRFEIVENDLLLNGIDIKSLSIDELDVFWQRAKQTKRKY